MKEIERLATLFGLDEKQMAFICIDEYDPSVTPHLNFSHIKDKAEDEVKYRIIDKKPYVRNQPHIKEEIKTDTALTRKIKMMEEVPPAQYLRMLQNNTMPASSDLSILNTLSQGYNFSNGVINAIIDYVLYKNDNVLSRNYCEKVASTLARNNITTTIEAMDNLNKISLNSKAKVKKAEEKVEESKPEPKVESTESNVDDEELNALMNKFKETKKGGK